MNTTTELIRKRNRELDLAHYALTAESRKKHREEVNRLNREIRLQSAGFNRRFCGAKRTRCGASGLNL